MVGTNGALAWRLRTERFELTSTLTPDAENHALWIAHAFRNTSSEPLRKLSTQSCFHLVDAPQFISAFGERLWAKLDGKWMSTDQADRQASPDPRRVGFVRYGLRPDRVVVPSKNFPSAELLEEAYHPLIVTEAFGGQGAVGIGRRDCDLSAPARREAPRRRCSVGNTPSTTLAAETGTATRLPSPSVTSSSVS